MDPQAVLEVAKLLAVVIPLIVAVVGIWKTLAVVRVKIEAETRLKITSEIESQIKLLELFSRLMDVAHARSGYHFSETVAEHLIKQDEKQRDFSNAVIAYPVGVASQDAAIAAITMLAVKHEILREPAIQGLQTIKTFKPEIAARSLERIASNG
ncbi:hypothetical protein KUV95_17225 [Microbulbifer agarilyticus]|uniref:hypothetical protein n=1 Tax=Microbulbifer agarilyticus TaxID=260552 RepID=UPI001C947465|nr:hypothetical protein [Microbulbifer agarilyticus]MBY6213288.1 hypothetical protein [Microbulbifer agarilyticus]